MISPEVKDILKKKVAWLHKEETDLIITDFDDTIFSRKDQLENKIISENRWNHGNFVMRKIIGIDAMMAEYYLGKEFPKTISQQLRKNHDLILTAWYSDFQEAKIKACNLDHINFSIVPWGEEKILETIHYIINELQFIPHKITVYEDRPKYFLEYKNLLEDILDTKFEIMLVEMNGNDSQPKITKIDE